MRNGESIMIDNDVTTGSMASVARAAAAALAPRESGESAGGIATAASPWVDAFLRDRDRRYVTDEHAPRAARLLILLADEATSRGYTVLGRDDENSRLIDRDNWDWSHLVFRDSAGRLCYLQVSEMHKPFRKTEREAGITMPTDDMPLWMRARKTPFRSSGALKLTVRGDEDYGYMSAMKDSVLVRLEERVGEFFNTLVQHHDLAIARQRQQEEREQKRLRARELYRSKKILEALDAESRLQERQQRQLRYLDGLLALLSEQGDAFENVGDMRGIIEELRGMLDSRNPIERLRMRIARIAEPTEAELSSYDDEAYGTDRFGKRVGYGDDYTSSWERNQGCDSEAERTFTLYDDEACRVGEVTLEGLHRDVRIPEYRGWW